MWKIGVAWFVACLLAMALLGCSRGELPPINFTPTRAVAETTDPQGALEATREACQAEARKKGIASVTAILLRRPKTAESDYIACMKERGYEVAQ